MTYAQLTIQDKNFLKRWIQRRRLSDASRILQKLPKNSHIDILDFGAGNGELARMISNNFPHAKIICYEPNPSLYTECVANVAGLANVVCINQLSDIGAQKFDYIFCLEVFEHLPTEIIAKTTTGINTILKEQGVFVVGVPHELYLPALFKGIFRMMRRFNAYDAQPMNILRCVLGFPPPVRPIAEISAGLPYHFEHLGFDYRKLKATLTETFVFIKTFCSPIKLLGTVLNSEIYFVMRKR